MIKTTKSNEKKLTQSQLARALGTTRQNIAYHERTGNPPPRSDVQAWVEYLAVNGREGTLPREVRLKLAEQRFRLIKAQADRAEIENQVKREELIEFDKVSRWFGPLMRIHYWGELERIAQEYPALLKGKNEVDIHEAILKDVAKIKDTMRNLFEIWKNTKGKV
jgi:hypothetical protein